MYTTLRIIFLILPIASAKIKIRVIPLGAASSSAALQDLDHIPLDDFLTAIPLNGPSHAESGFGVSGGLDSVLGSILNEFDKPESVSQLSPVLKNHVPDTFGRFHPCHADAENYCSSDVDKQQPLHCLGMKARGDPKAISDKCAKSIERSVPFRCGPEISLYCRPEDTLEIGVLGCLEKNRKFLNAPGCTDAMDLTRQLVSKVNKGDKLELIDDSGQALSSTANYGIFAARNYRKKKIHSAFLFVVIFPIFAVLVIGYCLLSDRKKVPLLPVFVDAQRELGDRKRLFAHND